MFFFFSSFDIKKHQKDDMYFYRPDIGMYFQYHKNPEKERISYMVDWDFYFSLKNDSIAIIQEIKNKTLLAPMEYKVSLTKNSTFVKRSMTGKIYKTEKMYFRKIYI